MGGGGGLFDGRDLDAAERAVDRWEEGFEQRARRGRELAARMAGLSAAARSPDGLIEVTVGRSGELVDLRLGEDVRRRSAAATARDILATVTAARAALAERATVVVAETIGADTDAGRAVLASYRPVDHPDRAGAAGDDRPAGARTEADARPDRAGPAGATWPGTAGADRPGTAGAYWSGTAGVDTPGTAGVDWPGTERR